MFALWPSDYEFRLLCCLPARTVLNIVILCFHLISFTVISVYGGPRCTPLKMCALFVDWSLLFLGFQLMKAVEKSEVLSIVGDCAVDAVLCSRSKTYDMKRVETSNWVGFSHSVLCTAINFRGVFILPFREFLLRAAAIRAEVGHSIEAGWTKP